MLDLANEHDVVALLPYRPGLRLLVASDDGRGFLVDGEEALAQTRAGKQVLTPAAGARAMLCLPADGDAAAFVGDNRRLLVVDLAEIPEMARGRGVILQRYKDGHLVDARMFNWKEGLRDANGRTFTPAELKDYRGARGQAGRIVPRGFAKANKFG
jgi:topoisomerase-4 subunit A